jgi:predicted DNA-binding transcriptional regulator AlpA
MHPYYVVSAPGVAWLLGVSPARVDELAATEGFPEPVAKLTSGFQWNKADIEEWASQAGWELAK